MALTRVLYVGFIEIHGFRLGLNAHYGLTDTKMFSLTPIKIKIV